MNDIEKERNQAEIDSYRILDYYNQGKFSAPKPCVVFDIDDTLIDSRDGSLIEQMVRVYDYVKKLGIPIFLVTARPVQYIKDTKQQLAELGITGYQNLFHVGYDEVVLSQEPYLISDKARRKSFVRKLLEEYGYQIILNLGDDEDDHKYGSFMYGIKLPYL